MDFVEHLKKYLSDNEINELLKSLLEKEDKHALVLNQEKMKTEDFLREFPNVTPHPIVPNCFIYDKNNYPFGKMIYHEMGIYYILEPCSALVSYLLNPQKDDLILDVAASPGGKSIHSSILMKNEGLIISNEIQTQRSFILSSNVERMGRKNIVVTNNTIDDFLPSYQNTFSKIILDAPCSGSGMFRKLDAMKQDWTYAKVTSLSSLQKDLILKAYQLLSRGGRLVYSTCSFSYEEDEEVIQYLLNQTDAKLCNIEDNVLFYKSTSKIGIHLFPNLFPGEGHYICLIEKPLIEENIKSNKSQIDKYNDIRKLCNIENGFIYNHEKTFYYLNHYFNLKGLHLIRGGLKLGNNEKYGFDYDHALSHYLHSFKNEVELSYDEAKKYIKGEQLIKNVKDGYILLKYNHVSLGFGKANKNKINNKYPKGLRIDIKNDFDLSK